MLIAQTIVFAALLLAPNPEYRTATIGGVASCQVRVSSPALQKPSGFQRTKPTPTEVSASMLATWSQEGTIWTITAVLEPRSFRRRPSSFPVDGEFHLDANGYYSHVRRLEERNEIALGHRAAVRHIDQMEIGVAFVGGQPWFGWSNSVAGYLETFCGNQKITVIVDCLRLDGADPDRAEVAAELKRIISTWKWTRGISDTSHAQ